MKTYTYAILCGLLFACSACSNSTDKKTDKSQSDTIFINDYNLLFVPDLSNRIDHTIHPKPVNDTSILANILDSVVTLIDLNNRRTNQTDSYKFDFINKGILNKQLFKPENLEINLARFKNNPKAASNYLRSDIKNDIDLFKKAVQSIYDYAQKNPVGADLWNYFNETINTSITHKAIEELSPKDQPDEDPIVFKKFNNVVVLFTDGYIENANKTKGYVLDKPLIERIRKDFLATDSKDLKTFILAQPKYLLNKTTNDLAGIHILVLEMMDRSLDADGVAIKQPTDFQIMKIIWEDWLKKSGAETIAVHQTVSKKEDAYAILKKFMEDL